RRARPCLVYTTEGGPAVAAGPKEERTMTEQEWLGGTDPEPMLDFLRGRASDRKLRLFACACGRPSCSLPGDDWRRMAKDRRNTAQVEMAKAEADLARQAVELAERYADGLIGREELAAFYSSPDREEAVDCYAGGPDAAATARGAAYRARYCARYLAP